MGDLKFNTEKNFWQRSKIFYSNQIVNLGKLAQSENVLALIGENRKELQRVDELLKNYNHAK